MPEDGIATFGRMVGSAHAVLAVKAVLVRSASIGLRSMQRPRPQTLRRSLMFCCLVAYSCAAKPPERMGSAVRAALTEPSRPRPAPRPVVASVAPSIRSPEPPWRCETAGRALQFALPNAPIAGIGTVIDASGAIGTLIVREHLADERVIVDATWSPPGATFAPMAHASYVLSGNTNSSVHWRPARVARDAVLAVRCVSSTCEPVRLTGAIERVPIAIPDREFVVADDGRTAVLLTTGATSASDGGSPSGVETLVAFEAHGEPRTTEISLATHADAPIGPFVLDGQVGVVRALENGETLLEPLGLPSRIISSPRTTDVCPSEARGDLALPISATLAVGTVSRAVQGVAHYAVLADRLCVRRIVGEVEQLGRAGWLSAAPGIDGITGLANVYEGMPPIRCSPPNARHSATP